jgi:phosphohistidine phosphatase
MIWGHTENLDDRDAVVFPEVLFFVEYLVDCSNPAKFFIRLHWKGNVMILYLLRHAIAAERGSAAYSDSDRPLTPEGKEKMEQAADSFPSLIGEVGLIASSPYLRARETAMIAAHRLRGGKKIRIVELLAPGGSIDELFQFLEECRHYRAVMVVGHEPDLGTLASLLLGVDRSAIELKKGALCAVSISGTIAKGCGLLIFLLQPKQLRALRIAEKVSRHHPKKK